MSTITSIADLYKNPDDDPKGPYVLTDITAPFERALLTFDWRGYALPRGRSWRYTAEKLDEFANDGRIVFSGTRPRLKRYLSEVAGRQDTEEEPPSPSRIEFIVRNCMRAIAAAIASDPTILSSVEWRDLERVMREVFETIGFTTRLTRPGKDGGFDLELTCSDNGEEARFLVELKHWTEGSSRPGMAHVTSFFEVVARSTSDTGVLLSSSGFTDGAITGRTQAEAQIVRLGDSDKIVSLCESFIESESGIWTQTSSLPQVLIHDTY